MTKTFERSNAQSNISEHSQSTYEYPYSGYVNYQTLDREGQRDPRFLDADVVIDSKNKTFKVIMPHELAFNSLINHVTTPSLQDFEGRLS